MATIKIPLENLQQLAATILSDNRNEAVKLMRRYGMNVTTDSPQQDIDRAFVILNMDNQMFRNDFARLAGGILKGEYANYVGSDLDYNYETGTEDIFGAIQKAGSAASSGTYQKTATPPANTAAKTNFWTGFKNSITLDNIVGAVGLGLGIWGTVQQAKQEKSNQEAALKLNEQELEKARLIAQMNATSGVGPAGNNAGTGAPIGKWLIYGGLAVGAVILGFVVVHYAKKSTPAAA